MPKPRYRLKGRRIAEPAASAADLEQKAADLVGLLAQGVGRKAVVRALGADRGYRPAAPEVPWQLDVPAFAAAVRARMDDESLTLQMVSARSGVSTTSVANLLANQLPTSPSVVIRLLLWANHGGTDIAPFLTIR